MNSLEGHTSRRQYTNEPLEKSSISGNGMVVCFLWILGHSASRKFISYKNNQGDLVNTVCKPRENVVFRTLSLGKEFAEQLETIVCGYFVSHRFPGSSEFKNLLN